VVVVTITIIAAMLLPALSKAKIKAQGIQCMSNLKQLQIAWQLYSLDNREKLTTSGYTSPVEPTSWVDGWLDFNGGNTDNTNTAALQNANRSKFAPYTSSAFTSVRPTTAP